MISIFAKQAFLNVNSSQPFVYSGEAPKRGHLMRVSSMIRGDQIADAIGAKFNPTGWYQDDVCIYVKPHLKKDNMDFKFEGRKSYIDIIDGHNLGQLMVKYPNVGVIVCSEVDRETMSKELKNEIVLIPQHHCNFERVRRQNYGQVKRIGMIGTEDAFDYIPKELEENFNRLGFEFVKFSKFFTRQDIINFYMGIDIQLVWRPYKKILSNPLKIVNASSFGIPTIALDEPAFKEVEGCYASVHDISDVLNVLDNLARYKTSYDIYSNKCLEVSEKYHIDNIGKLYKELDK